MKKAYPIRLITLAFLFVWPALFPGPSQAATTGTLQGTVRDSSGAPLKGANVTLGGTGLVTVTDKSGSYLFAGVQPGTYTITADLVTYQSAQASVVLQQDNTITTDFSLVKKTITTGTSRIVGTPVRRTDTSTEYTITARTEQMEKTNPNNIYQFTGLVAGQPGIILDGAGFVHLRGADENQAGFMVDGVPIMDATSNQFTTNTVSVGLRSFNLIDGGVDSSYGGAMGGYINEVVANGKDFAVGNKLYGGHTEYTYGPGGSGWDYSGTHDEFGGILPGGKLDYYFSTIMFKNTFPGSTLLSSLGSSFDGLAKFNYYADPRNTVTLFVGQGFEEYNAYQPYNPSLTPFQTTHFTSGAGSAVDTGTFQQDHQVQHYYLNYLSFKHNFTPRSFWSYRVYTLTMPTEFHEENTTGVYERTAPSQLGNQLDYTNQLASNDQLRAGLLYLQQHTNYSTIADFGGAPMQPLGPDNPFYYDDAEKIKPTGTSLYLENELKGADDKFTLDLGTRFGQQHYQLDDGLPSYSDNYFDPRIGASYSPTRDFVVRTSYSVLSQFPETSFIEFLPPGAVGDTVTAIPGTDPHNGLTWEQLQALTLASIQNPFNHLNTEHDNDWDLGAEKAFSALGGHYDFSVTGFQRELYDEIIQDINPAIIAEGPPTSYDSSGHGHAGGAEVLLTKRVNRPTDWNGYVSYTNLSVKATSGFFDTNYAPYYYQAFHGDPTITQAQLGAGDNEEFPTSYDQKHTVAVLADKRVNKWLEFSGLMNAGSGFPYQNTLGTFTAAADAQHAVFSTGTSNFFAEVPITMPNQTSLQPFNATPGMSGWHYEFSLNTNFYLTQDTNLYLGVDNIFNSRTVLIYGTNPYNGPPYYLPPTPQYPQGRVYYGPRAIQNPLFVSFGIRTRF